ncbi:MAG: neutral zinc metallopeptidase [Porticoccaceae bacterium]|nr:neutral zinc metallopeptidase [Porticoccaceae bacterium]
MKWKNRRSSSNIEDRRGSRVSRKAKGGGLGAIVITLIAIYFGVDPEIASQLGSGLSDLGGSNGSTQTQSVPYRGSAEENQLAQFVAVVLADTEDTWREVFKSQGSTYREPVLVLFKNVVKSACGMAESAMGPFYCPADSKIYIDLSFYNDLKQRHGAPGDFAQAYVIAHEVGHHVQSLLGTSSRVHQARRGVSKAEGNALSVKLELQADCFAGLWAYHTERAKSILEVGDTEEALNAASAIGDDRLQKQGQGYVVPESFTHGTSAQRVRWFKQGFSHGSVRACDTFS